MIFEWLAVYAWLVFTVSAIVFVGGSITLAYHLHMTNAGRYTTLFVISGMLLAIGYVLGGMQAGDRPFIAREILVPWVRLFWLSGALLGALGLTIYWIRCGRRCR